MNPELGKSSIALRVPLSLMVMSLCGLSLFPAALWRAAGPGAIGAFGEPSVLLFVHVTVIGMLFPAVMGVFYQLGPVAFVTRSLPERRAFSQVILYILSGAAFLLTWTMLSAWGWVPLAITGTAVVAAVIFFFVNALDTANHRSAGWPTTGFFYGAALQALVLVVGALTLVLGHASGQELPFDRWIGVHAFAGLYGVFVQMAVGLGYKLMPMFTLSHVKFRHTPRWVLGLLNGGLALVYAGLLINLTAATALGTFLSGAGLVVFAYDARRIYRRRMRRIVEWPLRGVFAAWGWISAATVLFAVWQLFPLAGPRVLGAFFLVVAVGGLGQMVVGYFFKIIPFLIWTDRYGKNGTGLGAPLLQNAVRPARSRAVVIGWNVAAAVVVLGDLALQPYVLRLGAVLFEAAALIGIFEWWRVLSPRGIFPGITAQKKGEAVQGGVR